MSNAKSKFILAGAAVCAALLSPLAISHFDDKAMPQSYRQSYFALMAANFGPLVASVKGEIPWDQAKVERWADDLATLAELDLMRGFVDGSDKGTTRAKPEIWQNKEDFTSKLDELAIALEALDEVAPSGDKALIAEAVGNAGKACKACHDDYKAEEYLY